MRHFHRIDNQSPRESAHFQVFDLLALDHRNPMRMTPLMFTVSQLTLRYQCSPYHINSALYPFHSPLGAPSISILNFSVLNCASICSTVDCAASTAA